MSNCGHYVLNTMYYMFRCTGTATYTKYKQSNGEYTYVPRVKKDAARLYIYIAVLITLMALGDFFIVMEITQSLVKPLDFDALTRIFVYIEPTVSSVTILMIFIKNTKKFLKSFETLNRSCNRLDEIKAPVSINLIRWFMKCFYTITAAGIILWYLSGFFLEKLFEAIYKSMGSGIALYIQGTIIVALFCHMTLTLSAFQALNKRLHQLRKTKELRIRKNYLRVIASIHGDLCKSHRDMFKFCFPTVVLFFVRAGLHFSIVFMAFWGMLARGDIVFLGFPLLSYGAGCFLTALVNDTLCSLSETTGRLMCRLTISFFDDDIGTMRNTLLLQMLHQNTNTTFFGISFTMKTLVISIGNISVFLSFIVQIRSWIEKSD